MIGLGSWSTQAVLVCLGLLLIFSIVTLLQQRLGTSVVRSTGLWGDTACMYRSGQRQIFVLLQMCSLRQWMQFLRIKAEWKNHHGPSQNIKSFLCWHSHLLLCVLSSQNGTRLGDTLVAQGNLKRRKSLLWVSQGTLIVPCRRPGSKHSS